jgi:hypothetical protein
VYLLIWHTAPDYSEQKRPFAVFQHIFIHGCSAESAPPSLKAHKILLVFAISLTARNDIEYSQQPLDKRQK